MATQNYANHAHQPRLFGVGAASWLGAVILLGLSWYRGASPSYVGLFLLLFALACALTIGRVYITALQDRIIRLEMRVRCAKFLSEAQMADLERLSIKQVVALRFASDAEMPGLLERALKENLPPTEIKKAVVNWVPDYHRT